jgi:hypothetical protein
MVKFFKTKQDIDDEYAAALLGLEQTLQSSPAMRQQDDDHASRESYDLSAHLLRTHISYVRLELTSVFSKIENIVAADPDTKPLMTRALKALKNAVEDSSAKNLRELFWTSMAVSRKGDTCKGLSASMAGIGLSLWLTSIIVAVAVSSAIALPLTFGVGTALIIAGAIVFLGSAQYLMSEDRKQSNNLASELKDIRAKLSSL